MLTLNNNPKNANVNSHNNYNNINNTSNYMESGPNNMLELSMNKTDNNLLSDHNKKVAQKPSNSFNKKSFKEERDDEDLPRKDQGELKSPSMKEDKSDKEDEEGEFNTELKRKLEKRDKIVKEK
jgi:hypothetical protein